MPKRRRYLPGNYKQKPEEKPTRNAMGPAPLTLFQGEDGRWGAKDGNGNIEINPIYRRIEDHHYQVGPEVVILASDDEVLSVSPDDWELLFFRLLEFDD